MVTVIYPLTVGEDQAIRWMERIAATLATVIILFLAVVSLAAPQA